MVLRILKFGLYTLGAAAICVALMIFFFGPHITAQMFGSILPFADTHISGLDHVNVDSEMRFYAVFWFSYGTLLIYAARNWARWHTYIPLLLSCFSQAG